MRLTNLLGVIAMTAFCSGAFAQDSTNFMNELIHESEKNKTYYAENTFKYTRVVDGHSIVNLPAHVLDVRISHRFDPINSGLYNFFGLDAAVMRLGFDYGITNNIMIGAGHSVYQKTYDAFLKIKLLRQSTGTVEMPVSLSFVPTVSVNTLKQFDSKTEFKDRLSYVFQLLVARKFSENFSLQLMPTFIHADKISFAHVDQNIVALGIATTHRISKRLNVNAEYYYRLNDNGSKGHNVLSFGIDLGTGGHVFQLHFTNSIGMTEKSFIAETMNRWEDGDVLFGFNISRVFQLKKKNQ
ncbi:MAG TPA: DUF5777 family beta-barrel protein [Hanamia sp.]|nr:DUF5777 family beta-barrel protein [Hanamia sp.]